MDLSNFKTKYSKIPNNPGVYFFVGKKKEILYIGKATSLKQRVKSYFDGDIREKRSPVIEKMVADSLDITWTETDSVLEAMLLETNLIRVHKPVCNTRSKDDKSFNHVVITNDEFPRVLVVRGKDLINADASEYSHIFGPFPSGLLFKEALKIVRKLFKFYDTKNPIETITKGVEKGKIDFNRQIGLYPESCSKAEYARSIKHICLFFQGKKQAVIDDLERQMSTYAQREEFEKANIIKKKIFALKHIQDISLIKDDSRVYRDESSIRIEAYDIAHLQGDSMVGVMVVLNNEIPDKSSYRKFNIQGYTASNDVGALSEVLERRLNHPEWPFPQLMIIDGSTAQRNAALKALKRRNLHIEVVGVVKDERHKPLRCIGSAKLIKKYETAILYANAESHRFAITFHRNKRDTQFLP